MDFYEYWNEIEKELDKNGIDGKQKYEAYKYAREEFYRDIITYMMNNSCPIRKELHHKKCKEKFLKRLQNRKED